MDINELVKKSKQGDVAAFETLYQNFSQKIFRYILFKIQSRQEAEDLLQDIFIRAYRGLSKLSLENLNFSAWLYKIAGNTINDYFRKLYRRPQISPIDETFDPADDTSLYKNIEMDSELATTTEVFKRLPEKYQMVLELRFIRDYSPKEVAKLMNKSSLAVRLLQCRALKKVRGELARIENGVRA